ncbi:MAG TPA: electron transfer flavoprotein subunit alpha/FixB family protein [Balneolaceae bacterium]|nr:electron transfer flavoprotein subunit alpha/FixB family protein [Balneolaceae bacterium]|tara:strand:+ start:13008 stop:13982 length:975 start_codon:yes stop_codon:yes gene_type:complete
MNSILTYIAIADGKIKRSSLEVLSRCKELANENGLTTEAVVLHPNAESFTDQISTYGADTIYINTHEVFTSHNNEAIVEALTTTAETSNAGILAFASTEGVKDVLGALASKLNSGVVSDVSSFSIEGDAVKATRPVMAAKMMADVTVTGSPVLVSVRSGSYELTERASTASISEIEYSPSTDFKAVLKEILSAQGDTIDLNEAEAIVAAGRGVKDEEGRALISELASVLNAGIGASRALTEAGDYDPSLQIGQTGKVVSPQLYIAVGISGAIQHVAGMANSKVIVAINKDPDAPIFEVADYGLVGDLYKVLPPFIAAIKEIKQN